MLRIASASECLVITGYWIDDIKIAKKAWVLPWLQSSSRFSISPVNYTFEVQVMSADKFPLILPVVFTIGPHSDDDESLRKYAKLIAPHNKQSNHHVKELVMGIIEGETRTLAASMTMEKIFQGDLKPGMLHKVQLELDPFGLWIYNANYTQVDDVPGNDYFSELGAKAQAEANMKGEIGLKIWEAKTLQNAAKIDAETKMIVTQTQGQRKKEEIKVMAGVKVFENEREAEVGKSKVALAIKKAKWVKDSKVAEVEASNAVALREAELQKEVEIMKTMTQTAKYKAKNLNRAIVKYETKVLEANWEHYKRRKEAEAILYEKQKEAEAQKATAEASLYSRQKEAEGLVSLANGHGTYLQSLLGAAGGNYATLRDYLIIERGMLQEIAKSINAEAFKGSGASTSGGGEGGGGGAMQECTGLYKMLPPIYSTVHNQTLMLPPTWTGEINEP